MTGTWLSSTSSNREVLHRIDFSEMHLASQRMLSPSDGDITMRIQSQRILHRGAFGITSIGILHPVPSNNNSTLARTISIRLLLHPPNQLLDRAASLSLSARWTPDMLEKTAKQRKSGLTCRTSEWLCILFAICSIPLVHRVTILFLEILLPLEALRRYTIQRRYVPSRFTGPRFEVDYHAWEGGELPGTTEAADGGRKMCEFVLWT